MTDQQPNVVIIGASVSGLASAASLQRRNIEYTIIEKHDRVAMPWRRHYQRLHLHSDKSISSLPYKKFGRAIPRYPGRQEFVDYLDEYQEEFNIHPVFNTEVQAIKWEKGNWISITNNGVFKSKYLIMATGAYAKPRPIVFRGMEGFPGRVLHSSEYRTGKEFERQKVLVVGFGNSACEIAIDLYEQGAHPYMSVRSPINVIPRDVLGIPVLQLSLLMRRLPPRLADAISAPLIRALVGDIDKLGLRTMAYGPLEEVSRHGNVPVIDIGTIRHIRQGHIKILGEIDFIEGKAIHFKDGRVEEFDVIVAAIGYNRNYSEILQVEKDRFDDLRIPIGRQKYFGKDGLYFCGYCISPTGQIREIGLDAMKIAEDIAKKESLLKDQS